jgi:hypothetical protein
MTDILLHELCHNECGSHDDSFYKLWDTLRAEMDGLLMRGYAGEGSLAISRPGGSTPFYGKGNAGPSNGFPDDLIGPNFRDTFRQTISRRGRTDDTDCFNGKKSKRDMHALSKKWIETTIRTQASTDNVNDAAGSQALWNVVKQDLRKNGTSRGGGGAGDFLSTRDRSQTLRDPFSTSTRDPSTASRDPFTASRTTFAPSRDPYAALRDSFLTPRNPVPASTRDRPQTLRDPLPASTQGTSLGPSTTSRGHFPALRTTSAAPRDPFPTSRDTYKAPRDPLPASEDTYATSRDPLPVPRDTYAASRNPFPASGDTYKTPRDPLPASEDTYATSRDPFPVSPDPYMTPRNPYAARRVSFLIPGDTSTASRDPLVGFSSDGSGDAGRPTSRPPPQLKFYWTCLVCTRRNTTSSLCDACGASHQ